MNMQDEFHHGQCLHAPASTDEKESGISTGECPFTAPRPFVLVHCDIGYMKLVLYGPSIVLVAEAHLTPLEELAGSEGVVLKPA
jgi:hypothetical protein